MDPTHRVAYKKWDHKFNHYDENLQNWDNNKKKLFNVVLMKHPLYMGGGGYIQ